MKSAEEIDKIMNKSYLRFDKIKSLIVTKEHK